MLKRCAVCGTPLVMNIIWACDCGGRKGARIDPPVVVHVLAEPPLPSSAGVLISPRLGSEFDRVSDNVVRLRQTFETAHRDLQAAQRRSQFRVIDGGRE